MPKPPPAISAATQRSSSAKGARAKARGKPFGKDNPYAWRPGESGNPAGTKGPKVSDLLREALSQQMPANKRQALKDLVEAGASIGQIIGFAVALKAAGGNLEALEVIADRTEGAPEQTIHVAEVTGDDLARAREKAANWEAEQAAAAAQVQPHGQ